MRTHDARLSTLVCAMTLLAAVPGVALTRPTSGPEAAMLLDVSVNGRDAGVMAVQEDGGRLFLPDTDFRKLALAVHSPADARGRHDLSAITGLEIEKDMAGQRLLLHVDPALLPRRLYDLANEAPSSSPSRSDSGAIFRYDLSLTGGDVGRAGLAGGGDFALDVFTPGGRFTSGGFVALDAAGWHPARLDSALIFESPGDMTHVIAGDAISGAAAFGRAVRFGGVQWGRDFSLQPGLVTQPLPAFFGQSEVPATIDVYSGAAKLYEQQIAPGPFELRHLPVLTGGGTATIVTRDVLGRQTSQSISLYTDAGLLAPGLQSWSLDAGFLRTGYGRASFAYDAPMLAASWRRGISNRLTLGADGQFAPGLMQLGGEGEWSFGFGTLAAGAGVSGGDSSGWRAGALLHTTAGPFNIFGDVRLASRGFRDLAALLPGEGGFAPPRLRYQAGVTADLGDAGTLGLSWLGIRQSRFSGTLIQAQNLLSASWSLPLPGGMFVGLGGLYDLASHANTVQVSLNLPLDDGLAGVTTAVERGAPAAMARYDDPANPDGGLGWRLAAGWQDGARLRAQVDWVGQHVALDGGLSLDGGAVAARANMRGALVLLRGSLFASHDPGQAVALVEAGEKNIRIYRENRVVAISDEDGQALLTGLDPFAPNHIAIEARDYDFDTLVEKTQAVVAPRRGSGVVVDLKPASRHPFLARVTRGIAMGLPPGARVRLDGQEAPLILGRDGMLFITDLERARGADIDSGTSRCRIHIEPARMGEAPPLLCLREAHGPY